MGFSGGLATIEPSNFKFDMIDFKATLHKR
jgi:hypothetical protein